MSHVDLLLPVFFFHLFDYFFNFLLILLLINKKVTRTSVYLVNMIVSEVALNISQTILIELPIVSNGLEFDKSYYSSVGNHITTLFNQSGFRMKYYIAFMLSLHRLSIVIKPTNKLFSSFRLSIYMIFGWIFFFSFNIYVFHPSDCYLFMDYKWFRFVSQCPEPNHPYRYHLARHFHQVYGTVTSMISLILSCISVFLMQKKRKMNFFQFFWFKKKSVTTGLSQTASEKRLSRERILLRNSLIFTIILWIHVLYSFLFFQFQEDPTQVPEVVLVLVGYINIYAYSCINFIMYFVLNFEFRTAIYTLLGMNTPKVTPAHIVILDA